MRAAHGWSSSGVAPGWSPIYDLKAINPNRRPIVDTRTPEELMDIIETKGREVDAALSQLRKSLRTGERPGPVALGETA